MRFIVRKVPSKSPMTPSLGMPTTLKGERSPSGTVKSLSIETPGAPVTASRKVKPSGALVKSTMGTRVEFTFSGF